MAAVISVKGIRRLIDGLTDHMIESARKLTKQRENYEGRVNIVGSLELDGKFSMDKEGDFQFSGEIEADMPVEGIPVDVEASTGAGAKWEHGGKGRLKISYEVIYELD